MNSAAIALVACAACTSFEDENIVIDTRILAMAASVPDQVVDVDLADPQMPAELLEQLVPSEMCALVADPEFDRPMRWSMTLCVLNNDERCIGSLPTLLLKSEIAEDPDTARPAPRLCATIQPDGNLLGILLAALEGDSLNGLGGIAYGVSLVVGPEELDREFDLYAGKTMTVGPRIPAGRQANNNPSVDRFDAAVDAGEPVPLPMGRCVDQTTPLEVGPRAVVRLTPIESADARELYVVPTLDGMMRSFTESLTYQWIAAGGGFSSGSTGGPRDFAGNPAPLFTDWRAPREEDLAGPTDVPVWIVQRDERLGARYYETCIRVVP